MKNIEPQPVKDTPVDGNSQVDIETIIEQIFGDLRGATSRSDIRNALMESVPKYENARIKTYIPILLRREVQRQLRSGLAPYQDAKASETENAAATREENIEAAKDHPGSELMPI